jgi:glyoxylase-like metal-dependent hydrolase (beta-lactamase superfamily II)
MASVKVLVEGFTNADSADGGEEKTCATICLVRDKDLVIVSDPGVLDSQQILIDRLKEEGLTVNDVNLVFITHSHIDHYRNIGMFPTAKTLEFFGLWDGGAVSDWSEQLTEDIRVIKTPGHNYDGLTMLVKTAEGEVAICGDVFWKENFPEVDAYASDVKELAVSRQKVLELADFIIPGHSGMYKVKK